MSSQAELLEFANETDVCPTCGDKFASPKGMMVHHAAAHDESISAPYTVTCDHCGDEYECHRSRVGETRFCSKECQIEHSTGENHPAWTADGDARGTAFKRDSGVCQRCGRDVSESDAGDGPTAEAHHIIPKAAGGPDTPENLVILCQDCHRQAHEALKTAHKRKPGVLQELRELITEGPQ